MRDIASDWPHSFPGLYMLMTLRAALLLATTAVVSSTSSDSFVFNGHHVGESRSSVAPFAECKDNRTEHFTICRNGRESIEGVSVDVAYTFRNDRLSGVSFLVDTVGFDKTLPALTKRYGAPSRLVQATGRDYAEWRFTQGRLRVTRTGSRARPVVFATFATTE
jgi:hypothetical protein